jgi:hypothetical protein
MARQQVQEVMRVGRRAMLARVVASVMNLSKWPAFIPSDASYRAGRCSRLAHPLGRSPPDKPVSGPGKRGSLQEGGRLG